MTSLRGFNLTSLWRHQAFTEWKTPFLATKIAFRWLKMLWLGWKLDRTLPLLFSLRINRVLVIYMTRWTHRVPEMSIFWSKSGVQRWSYSERMVNATENLIWYSESQENFLSNRWHPPETNSSSSGSKLRSKMPNFYVFAHFYHFLCIKCTIWEQRRTLSKGIWSKD